MRYLADQNISPFTVALLKSNAVDICRVSDFVPASTDDTEILELARAQEMTIVTQDLDFSTLIASSGNTRPSLVSVRLRDNRPEHVAEVLAKVLPSVESELIIGAIATVEDAAIRLRFLPVV